MARTYSSTPVLSKIKIGDSTYYLKDADARGILDGISADVYESLKLALGTVAAGGDNLVTAGNIKAYVDEIAELGFDVVKLAVLPTADAQAYADYHNRIVLIEDAGSISGDCIEYIIVRSGAEGSYTYAWEQIGSTKIDLSEYVKDVKYVAATHKLQQKKGEGNYEDVHTFGDLADADQAETTLDDYVVGVDSATVTAEGTINDIEVIDSVGALPSFTEGAFTPNIPTTLDLSKFSGGSKVADTFSANVPTALDLTKFNGGSKAADTFTAGSLPSKVADTWDAGSLPTKSADTFTAGSFTEGAFTPASLVTDTKALYKQGIKATIGTGADAETLIFTNVEKEADIQVVSSFNGGSKVADTFVAPTFSEGAFNAGALPSFVEGSFNAGALPTFSEGAFTAASLASGFYTAGQAASFSEGAFTPAALASGFYSVGSAAAKASDTFAAGSLPTKKSQAMTFSGSMVNVSVSLAKSSKTITVDPKAA